VPRQKGNLNCVYKQKFSAAERNRFYPFDIARTIKLASFRYHQKDYPIKNGAVIRDSLIEFKTLTEAQTNDLTDILYNNLYKTQPNYGLSTQCFLPRNAILFLDQSGQVKDYILICFHCDTHRESSHEINFGDEWIQKMEKLRQFFVSVGVQFGTDKNVEKYPGESFD
jgi:uncharacterized protein CbrC (UPF0167 family)